MRKWVVMGLGVSLALSGGASAARAQDGGISVHVGTLGLGARGAFSMGDQLRLRGGVDIQPFQARREISDIDYDVEFPTPALTALLDWHPGGAGFRFSGGVVYFTQEPKVEATPRENVEIGAGTFTPAQVGTLIGELGTSQIAPFFGIGWGDATDLGLGFQLDLGVAFHGTPDVALRATGPVGDQPGFQAELEAELADVNEEIERVRVYPVLNIGIGFGL